MIRSQKGVTSILTADEFYCLLGLDIFMELSAMFMRYMWQGAEDIWPTAGQELKSTNKNVNLKGDPFMVSELIFHCMDIPHSV